MLRLRSVRVARAALPQGGHMLDLLIRGGDVVTPQGVGRWSVGIQGEQIVSVGAEYPRGQAGRVIDASGKLVVPGGIEPHAHLPSRVSMQPSGREFTLGPEEDTLGMAVGGVTTHIDFCWVHPATDVQTALQRRMGRWKGKAR